MTREEALKQLHVELTLRDNECLIYRATKEVLEMAIHAIKKESKSDWIPVSERLPGEEFINKVILIDTNGDVFPVRMLEGINCFRGVWDFDNYSESLGQEAVFYSWRDIDAWKPLPEPYKGEEDGVD